jgi:hypothetical protein
MRAEDFDPAAGEKRQEEHVQDVREADPEGKIERHREAQPFHG